MHAIWNITVIVTRYLPSDQILHHPMKFLIKIKFEIFFKFPKLLSWDFSITQHNFFFVFECFNTTLVKTLYAYLPYSCLYHSFPTQMVCVITCIQCCFFTFEEHPNKNYIAVCIYSYKYVFTLFLLSI